ncbi:MAG: DUF6713 family protein [Acidovorax sp.]|jgi:hypothetical protein
MKAPNIVTQLMLAMLFTHELDAMTQSEWRLLYGLRSLTDDQGRWWFVAIHTPLFWGLVAFTHHANDRVQRTSRIGLAAFCIVHALLHWRLANDPVSTFSSPMSWSLILGAAALGVMFLGMEASATKAKKL